MPDHENEWEVRLMRLLQSTNTSLSFGAFGIPLLTEEDLVPHIPKKPNAIKRELAFYIEEIAAESPSRTMQVLANHKFKAKSKIEIPSRLSLHSPWVVVIDIITTVRLTEQCVCRSTSC